MENSTVSNIDISELHKEIRTRNTINNNNIKYQRFISIIEECMKKVWRLCCATILEEESLKYIPTAFKYLYIILNYSLDAHLKHITNRTYNIRHLFPKNDRDLHS